MINRNGQGHPLVVHQYITRNDSEMVTYLADSSITALLELSYRMLMTITSDMPLCRRTLNMTFLSMESNAFLKSMKVTVSGSWYVSKGFADSS